MYAFFKKGRKLTLKKKIILSMVYGRKLKTP